MAHLDGVGWRLGVGLFVVALVGCGSSREPDGCEGSGPPCLPDCRQDIALSADCVNGAWECPVGTVAYPECTNACTQTQLVAGEVCDEGVVACRPDAADYAECPSLLCLWSPGFEPRIEDGCRCARDTVGGFVRCEAVDPVPCAELDFCACHERADCAPQTDTCLCHCDYECPGHAPCHCDCGGGDYLGCAARVAP